MIQAGSLQGRAGHWARWEHHGREKGVLQGGSWPLALCTRTHSSPHDLSRGSRPPHPSAWAPGEPGCISCGVKRSLCRPEIPLPHRLQGGGQRSCAFPCVPATGRCPGPSPANPLHSSQPPRHLQALPNPPSPRAQGRGCVRASAAQAQVSPELDSGHLAMDSRPQTRKESHAWRQSVLSVNWNLQ